jgi:DNA-binding beta-propeller fold protein YncE
MIRISTKFQTAKKQGTRGCYIVPATAFMGFLIFWLMLGVDSSLAGFLTNATIKSIAQINIDDEGRPLNYPVTLFYDPTEEEIYVVNGSAGSILVYGPDFFPTISIGKGRGVFSPRGGQVLANGDVYLCQLNSMNGRLIRLSVLNGAFFLDKEIFLDGIPDTADFLPTQLAINQDGIIYLAGETSKSNQGVLVLDHDGTYLRRLQPTDMRRFVIEEEEKPVAEAEEAGSETEEAGSETEEAGPETYGPVAETDDDAGSDENSFADLPEEFRPRGPGEFAEGIGPIRIHYVKIDSTGKIYLISDETSKIYVYGPNESFLFSFGVKGGSPGQMSRPASLAVDENLGVIYVADYMRHTILVYNMAGTFISEFGGRGYGPGWFNYPFELALNKQGHLIVADLFNKRVQVLKISFDVPTPEIPNLGETPTDQQETPDSSDEPETFQETGGGQEETSEPPQAQFEEGLEKDNTQNEDSSSFVRETEDNEKDIPESLQSAPDGVIEEDLVR